MPPAFLFGEHVHLTLKLRVRRDALRLRQHHPPLHIRLINPPQQQPYIVPRLPLVQQLAEHLHPRHHRLARVVDPPDLHFLAHLHHPPLHPPPHHPPPPPNPEYFLHRHPKPLVHRPPPRRYLAVHTL